MRAEGSFSTCRHIAANGRNGHGHRSEVAQRVSKASRHVGVLPPQFFTYTFVQDWQIVQSWTLIFRKFWIVLPQQPVTTYSASGT